MVSTFPSTLRTKTPHFVHTMCSCVPHDSYSTKQLCPFRALTDLSFYWKHTAFSARYGTNICVYKADLLHSPRGSCSRIVLVFFHPYSRVAKSNLISVLDVTDYTCCGVRISQSFPETRVFSRSRHFLHIFRKIGRFVTMFTTFRNVALSWVR